MRLLLFSDLHLDAQFAWLGDPGAARRRRQALQDVLRRIAALAREESVDAVLCGGDLYEHERVTPDTVRLLQDVFASLRPVRVFIAPGNHDWCGAAGVYRTAEWSDNVHVFTGGRLEPVPLADGVSLWGAGHQAPAGTGNFLEGFRVDRSGVNLALFHGSERGWLAAQGADKAPHAPFLAEQIEAAGLDHALLGHYHTPRDAERYTYPGNPDPLAFGETGERGAVILTVRGDGSLQRERRSVAVSQVHDIAVYVTGCAHGAAVRDRVLEALRPLRGFVRATLHGDLDPDIDLHPEDLDGAAPWLDGLQVRMGDIRPAYDLESLKEEPTVRGQFVREVLAAGLPWDEERRVLMTGLRALDGREDLDAP